MAAQCVHQGDREDWALGAISIALLWPCVCCWYQVLDGSSVPSCLYFLHLANVPCPRPPPALGNTYPSPAPHFGAVMVKPDLHGIEYTWDEYFLNFDDNMISDPKDPKYLWKFTFLPSPLLSNWASACILIPFPFIPKASGFCLMMSIKKEPHKDIDSYTYTVEYCSAIKKNEVMPFATTWMKLETVILSEVSQTEKHKYHLIAPICRIFKNDTNELIY